MDTSKKAQIIDDTTIATIIEKVIKDLQIPFGFVKRGNTEYTEESIVLNNLSDVDIAFRIRNVIRIKETRFIEDNTDPKYFKHSVSVVFYLYHYIDIRQNWNEYWLRIFPIFEPI